MNLSPEGSALRNSNIGVSTLTREYNSVIYRDKCIRRIRTAFSTLLTPDAGSPTRATGVHAASVDTTSSTSAGRSFANVDQLLRMAETMSGFLMGN